MKINFEFLKNDIDPETQVKFPYYFDGVEESEADFKVMFIGNSITYHEKKPDIGWLKDCGMAATDIESDYVHLVLKHIQKSHPRTRACVFNGGTWECDNFSEKKFASIKETVEQFKPNLVIVRIGENFSKENLKNGLDPEPSFEMLFNECKDHADKVLVTSLFWHHDILDDAIVRASKRVGVQYIDINDLGEVDENKALGQYEHAGICGHPGNLGMKRIAERIIEKL
ncbi:MAG: SGNH/GDSL hydrolase family protein [Bacilli bacterium]|nr:SGNH/GDSL hydrolase family protein [Bacilli bacterium]